MTAKKVLFLAQEIHPYIEDSPIGKISQFLPQGIQETGYDIRTFMPNYGTINERRNQLHEVIRLSGMNLVIDDKVHQLVVKVASLPSAKMQVYFIDNDDFFSRKGNLHDEDGNLYNDNSERAVFFLRGVFETIKKLRWVPDIIHCQGWFTGLAPLYLRTLYKDEPALAQAKLVFSAYDQTPQQPFGEELTRVLGFDNIESPLLDGTALDKETFVQLVLKYVDGMVISTKEISPELLDAIHGSGKKYLDYHEPEVLVKAVDEFYSTL
ncbi:glycogen/starch synthase [Porphyromonas sp.]|uniref:glycogen/starch synthase n=1 Tax=Porphyromonas sp. TaxID=1924944 RepID=UPI0026DCF163|nr:glycogen/starch synthase [Porphyromonas sp.]MDO4771181.1 glycogen/starch synthase [Porphyromonas sp.]